MKKLYSLLAIILILTCLLSTFVSCKKDEPRDDTTTPAESDTTSKTPPMSEKEKEALFISAMDSLKALRFDDAYAALIQIPDYQSEGNMSVADYLSRFSYKVGEVFVYLDGEVDYTFRIQNGYDDYGFRTSTAFINSNTHEVTFTSSTTKNKVYSKVQDSRNELGQHVKRQINMDVWLYTYDDNGLLSKCYECKGTLENQFKSVSFFYYDDNGRLVKEVNYAADDETSTVNYTIEYTYNEQGLLTKEARTVTKENKTYETNYTYNSKGWLLSIKGYDFVDEQVKTVTPYEVTYVYNGSGAVVSEKIHYKDANGVYTPREELVSLDEKKNGIAQQVLSRENTYTYDEDGKIASMVETITYRTTETLEDGSTVTKDDNKIVYNHSYVKYQLYYSPFN